MSSSNFNRPKHGASLDRARNVAVRSRQDNDGLVRQQFTLPREAARAVARKWMDDYPKAAYWSRVETWRQLPNDSIEFTVVRLPSAD